MNSGNGGFGSAPPVAASHNAQLILDKAQRALARGDIAKARRHFTRTIEYFPTEGEAYYRLASLDVNMKNFEPAVTLLQEAVELEPDNQFFLFLLGYSLFSSRRPFDAIVHLRKTLQINPNDHLSKLVLAHAYLKTDARDRGRKCLDAVNMEDIARPADLLLMADITHAYSDYERTRHLLSGLADQPALRVVTLYQLSILPDRQVSAAHQKLIDSMVQEGGLERGDESRLRFAAGNTADAAGRYDEAFEHYRVANSSYVAARGQPDPAFDLDRFDRSVRRMMELFDPDFIAARRDPGKRGRGAVFLVGLPRSGKSLVESVLARHRSISGAGEIDLTDFVPHQLMMGLDGGLAEDFETRVAGLDADAAASLASGYTEHIDRFGAELVVNTAPYNANNLGVIKLLWPDAKIIHVSRDALDNCLLCYAAWFSQPHLYTNNLDTMAGYLVGSADLMEHWKKVHRQDILALSYEDFVEDPLGKTSQILQFLGIVGDEATPDVETDRVPEYEGRVIDRAGINHARNYHRHLSGIESRLSRGQS